MLCMLPLIVAWCRDGAATAWQSVRRNPSPTLGWAAPAVFYVLYVFYASASGGDSYQQAITDRHAPLSVLYHALPRLFDTGIARALVGGWIDAWGMARKEFLSHAYLLVFGCLCAACVLLSPRTGLSLPDAIAPPVLQDNRPPLFRMATAGVALLALGYLPYMFSGSHVLISQRTFLFATFGAALMMLALIVGLARWARPLAAISVLWLMTCGAAAQLYQFHHYVLLSDAQRKVLRTIVENFDPANQGDRSLVILDHSNQLGHVWMMRNNLDLVLTYLYGRPIARPESCLMPGGEWQRLDNFGRTGHCTEHKNEWEFSPPDPLPQMPPSRMLGFTRPKSQFIELVIDQDGRATPDPALDGYRQHLNSADTPAARRYRNILRPASAGETNRFGLFKPVRPVASYRWDFGTWWSMERPIRGSGWHEAEWTRHRLRHDAAAWKSQERSRLLFPLEPLERPYALTGRFDIILGAEIQNSISVQVNGVGIPITWTQDYRFEAPIPQGTLHSGINTIEFDSTIDAKASGLSAKLSEFEVRPAN